MNGGLLFGKRYNPQEVVESVRKGEESVLVFLYEHNYVSVKNEIEKRSGQTVQAQSYLRYALIQLWQYLQHHDWEPDQDLHAFIISSAIRHFEESPGVYFPLEDAYQQRIQVFSQYLRYLDTMCRKLLFLHQFDKLEDRELARRLNFGNEDVTFQKRASCKRKLSFLIQQNFSKSERN